MTGKDLIIYILENGLLDSPVFENGKLLGFMTSEEAAVKFGVGVSTITTWVRMGFMPGYIIGNELYIPAVEDINPTATIERSN